MIRLKRSRLLWTLAVLLLGGALVALFIRDFEVRHYASAVLEIRRLDGTQYGKNDKYLILTEMAAMRSPGILKATVHNLRLDKAWSTPDRMLTLAEAEARLRDAITISMRRDTGWIELGAWDRDPQRAPDIANTVTALYSDQRLQDQREHDDQEYIDFLQHLKRRAQTTTVLTRLSQLEGMTGREAA